MTGRLAFLAGLAAALAASTAGAQSLVDSRLEVETWASGLSSPTTFTWIGPGEMLVIQKNNGQVKWIQDGVVKGTALDLTVQNDSERGGLGIAADPDFANNKYVYVYYSATSATGDSSTSTRWVDNRVVRYEWNGTNLINAFGPILAFPASAGQASGPNHDGGVIRFGPDGMLYGQTGDLNRGRMGGGTERVEQNTATTGSAFVGGIFRVQNDGSVPSDNPFLNESDANFHLWWSYGLRNGFGMCWDAVTGNLWNTENGPNVYDEVCRVPKGMNSGWLKIMGPDSRDARYGENGNQIFDSDDLTALDGSIYVDPELSFLSPIGITAIAFLDTRRFPADLRDECVLGDNNTGNLYLAPMKFDRDEFKLPTGLKDKVADDTTERNKLVWGSSWNVVTDLQIGADGYLYVASLGRGSILRIRPLTDTVDPAKLRFVPGVFFTGKKQNVEVSDDRYYTAEEKPGWRDRPPFKMLASFVLNEVAPTSIVVELEDKFGTEQMRQKIFVYNVVAAKWDKVDDVELGTTDVLRSITLSNPTDYIDPADLTVDVRIDVSSSNSKHMGTLPRPPVKMRIDLLQLLVTYP